MKPNKPTREQVERTSQYQESLAKSREVPKRCIGIEPLKHYLRGGSNENRSGI